MKKKTFAAILCAACMSAAAMTGTGMPASAAASVQQTRIMGDLNGDLAVDAVDAQRTLHLYVDGLAGKADLNADMENGYVDIDMDGQISASDAQSILSYYCRTLSGKQPLWAEYRDVSYVTEASDADGNQGVPFSKTGMYVEIGCAQGAPGETVSVPVYIAGAPMLAGFQFYLNHAGGAELTGISIEGSDIYGSVDEVLANADPECGALIWVNARGANKSIRNGAILGTYSYQIPEDAKPGDHYSLTIERNSMFVTNEVNGAYQYTLLDGVIMVQ